MKSAATFTIVAACLALLLSIAAGPALAAGVDATTSAGAHAANAEPLYPMSPERQAKLAEYSHFKNVWRFAEFFIGIAILLVILFTGLSARMRDVAERFKRPFMVVVMFLALFTLVDYLFSLPFNIYRNFVVEDRFGFVNQTFWQWWGEDLVKLGVAFLVTILPVWGFYALVRKSRRWWLWLTAGAAPFVVFMIVVAPIWIAPLTNDYVPLKDEALKTNILALAHGAGIDGADVFEVNASKQSSKVNAYVTGLFSTKRIVLYDTLISGFTVPEIRFVMGHEMGHYILHHVWYLVGMVILFIGLANWLVHRTMPTAIRRFGKRVGIRELGDVASLPLVLIYVSVFSFLFNPVMNGPSRMWEHQADKFGMDVAGVSGETAAVAFEKLSAYNLSDPDPSPLVEFWFYNHPSIKKRIAFVRSYKPHTPGAG